MIDLSPAEFAAYFEAVHGSPPFPWQERRRSDQGGYGSFTPARVARRAER